ncbi:MAG TPA: DUF4870 domain-containing protein [Paludibacter sp.]|nr:DUF4870 domain-containing protein [Paludibacter sp.]
MKENRGLLMMINFSALSFVLFPVLGVVLPLSIWLSNKKSINDLDKTGRRILNFQITWLILLVLWFLFISSKLVNLLQSGNMAGGITTVISMKVIGLLFLYSYNFSFVIINAFRIDRGKELFYFPSIPFFRIKK